MPFIRSSRDLRASSFQLQYCNLYCLHSVQRVPIGCRQLVHSLCHAVIEQSADKRYTLPRICKRKRFLRVTDVQLVQHTTDL